MLYIHNGPPKRQAKLLVNAKLRKEGNRKGQVEIRRVSSGFAQFESPISELRTNDFSVSLLFSSRSKMKGSGTLVASVVAASTMALTTSPSSSNQGFACATVKNGAQNSQTASGKEKFEPKFDGLRFIETLVTAHR